jgi:hypothetical protein
MTRARRSAAARNRSKQRRINLGLAISAASLGRGERRPAETLAAFCGCSKQAIEQTEYNAILKVRLALKKRFGIVSTTI